MDIYFSTSLISTIDYGKKCHGLHGFVDILRHMGYSGLRVRKRIETWIFDISKIEEETLIRSCYFDMDF